MPIRVYRGCTIKHFRPVVVAVVANAIIPPTIIIITVIVIIVTIIVLVITVVLVITIIGSS